MLILGKLTKLLLIVLLAYCFKMNPAYATGNSLDSGTLILTPNGNVEIEDLHSGDRLIRWFEEKAVRPRWVFPSMGTRTKTTGEKLAELSSQT